MKHTFKKVLATISAAVMCAIPTVTSFSVNAAAPDNARYTFRKDYFVKYSANIDRIIFGWGMNSNGTSTPLSIKKVSGNLDPYGSGAVNYHMGGGTFYPSNSGVTGLVLTEYIYTNKTVLNGETTTLGAVNKNNVTVNNSVYAAPSFMVGDIDGDADVDAQDYNIIYAALQKYTSINSFTYNSTFSVTLGGQTKSYYTYKIDINNDGKFNSSDEYLLNYFNSHPNYRFAN